MKKPALIAACLLLAAVAHADFPDMPLMKEGLWKIRMVDSAPGQKPTDNTYTLCRDHAYDQKARDLARKFLTACTTNSSSNFGSKRTVVMTCKVAGSTVTSKSTLTFSGDTQFHTETTSTFTPALYGQTQDTMMQDQTFLGACPAGMHPGDRKLADGTTQQHR
jgi:hypothetical protein